LHVKQKSKTAVVAISAAAATTTVVPGFQTKKSYTIAEAISCGWGRLPNKYNPGEKNWYPHFLDTSYAPAF